MNGGPREDGKIRVGEGLKSFSAVRQICNVTNVNLGVKRELCERVAVPTVKFRAEIWSVKDEER